MAAADLTRSPSMGHLDGPQHLFRTGGEEDLSIGLISPPLNNNPPNKNNLGGKNILFIANSDGGTITPLIKDDFCGSIYPPHN